MLGYLFADIICSEKRTVFREHGSRKTYLRASRNIMSKDKYPSIFFAPNGDYCGYYPSNIFRITHSFENQGISLDTQGEKRETSTQNLQKNNVAWQVEGFCISCFTTFIICQMFSLENDWSIRVTWPNILQLRIFPNFQNRSCCENYLKDNKHNSLWFGMKIFSHICPWTLSVPRSSQFSLSYTLGKLFAWSFFILRLLDMRWL